MKIKKERVLFIFVLLLLTISISPFFVSANDIEEFIPFGGSDQHTLWWGDLETFFDRGLLPIVPAVETGTGTPASTGAGGAAFECSTSADCPIDEYCLNNICMKIFDLKTISVDSPIAPGEFFDFVYFVKGMADISGDVTLNFWIEDGYGEIISSGSDVIYVGSFEEKTESASIFIPSYLADGSYTFKIKLSFEGYEIFSHRTIEISKSAPLILFVNIMELNQISANTPWKYSTVISANKDRRFVLDLENKIYSSNGEIVWFKNEELQLNRTAVLTNEVDGLASGTYQLEVLAKYGDLVFNNSKIFVVGAGVGGDSGGSSSGRSAIFGQAISGAGNVIQGLGFWMIIILVVIILIGGSVALTKNRLKNPQSKRSRTISDHADNIDKLEGWVHKMILLKYNKQQIEKIIFEQKEWSKDDLMKVYQRMQTSNILKGKYYLNEKKMQEIRRFVVTERRKRAGKEEVLGHLLTAGWAKEVIIPFINAYYD